jgi:hypothetical protein
VSTPQTNLRDPYEAMLDSFEKSARPAQPVRQRNRYGAYDAQTEGQWSISDAPKVKDWFRKTYNRDLPVSAMGQSGTHNKMGLDHANSMDVGLNPTTTEGAALVSYLKQNNIPFLAYDRAVKHAATAAHIHVGYPSHKGQAGTNPHVQDDPYTSMLVNLEQKPNPYDSILDDIEKGVTPAKAASPNAATTQPVQAETATRSSSIAPQPPPPTYEPQVIAPTGLEAKAQLEELRRSRTLLDRARTAYPLLSKYDVAYKESPDDNSGRVLEFYPQGERDSFDSTKPAVEVYGSRAKPEDVAGDIVSHHLAQGADPTLTNYYQKFQRSLTPEQKSRLQEQYTWAKKNEGEARPYADWLKASGLPAYFRGYAFSQWPDAQKLYTPAQIKMFDEMTGYLRAQPESPQTPVQVGTVRSLAGTTRRPMRPRPQATQALYAEGSPEIRALLHKASQGDLKAAQQVADVREWRASAAQGDIKAAQRLQDLRYGGRPVTARPLSEDPFVAQNSEYGALKMREGVSVRREPSRFFSDHAGQSNGRYRDTEELTRTAEALADEEARRQEAGTLDTEAVSHAAWRRVLDAHGGEESINRSKADLQTLGRDPGEIDRTLQAEFERAKLEVAREIRESTPTPQDAADLLARQQGYDHSTNAYKMFVQPFESLAGDAGRMMGNVVWFTGKHIGWDGARDVGAYLKRRAELTQEASGTGKKDLPTGYKIGRTLLSGGLEIAKLVTVAEATGFNLATVMAGESVARNLDKDAGEQVSEATKAYLMGKALEIVPGAAGEGAERLPGALGTLAREYPNAASRTIGATVFGGLGAGQSALQPNANSSDVVAEGMGGALLGGVLGGRPKEGPIAERPAESIEAIRRTESPSSEPDTPHATTPETVPQGQQAQVPPVPEGYTRFYRADSADTTKPTGQNWVANNPEYVSQKYGAGQMGSETVWYTDVPNKVFTDKGDAVPSHTSSDVLRVYGVEPEPKLYRRVESSSVPQPQSAQDAGTLGAVEPPSAGSHTLPPRPFESFRSDEGRRLVADLMARGMTREGAVAEMTRMQDEAANDLASRAVSRGVYRLPDGTYALSYGDGRVDRLDPATGKVVGTIINGYRAMHGGEFIGRMDFDNPEAVFSNRPIAEIEADLTRELSVNPDRRRVEALRAQLESARGTGAQPLVETPHHSEIQPRSESGQFRKVTTQDLREAREQIPEEVDARPDVLHLGRDIARGGAVSPRLLNEKDGTGVSNQAVRDAAPIELSETSVRAARPSAQGEAHPATPEERKVDNVTPLPSRLRDDTGTLARGDASASSHERTLANFETGFREHFKLPERQAHNLTVIADELDKGLTKWGYERGELVRGVAGIESGAGKGDALNQPARAKADEPRNLVVAHNLSERNLLFADKMGGLAMPSLAVTKKDSGFSGYGEITLLADKSMIDPKARVPVTDADMYSPRYPSVQYDINRKGIQNYWRGVTENWNRHYPNAEIHPAERYRNTPEAVADKMSSDGVEGLENNQRVMAHFLAEKGEPLPTDPADLSKIVRDGKYAHEFSAYTHEVLESVTDRQKFFKGYTNAGYRRYADYNLDNVVRQMKSEMKEGEGFFYGAGSVRSKAAKRYRSIEQIQKDRDRITTRDEMDAAKSAMNDRLFKLAEEARPHYKYEGGFGYTDEFAKAVAEGAQKKNLRRALEEYGFEGVDTKPIEEFLNDLRALPTEYFEAKPQRAVGLHEFKVAVVPDNISTRARNVLERKGLEVVTYKAGDSAARNAAIEEATNAKPDLLFQKNSAATQFLKDGTAIIRALNDPNVSSGYHEFHHVFAPHFAKAVMRVKDANLKETGEAFFKWLGFRSASEFSKLHDGYVNETLSPEQKARYTAGQEKGSRGFERYMKTGVGSKRKTQTGLC